LHQDRRDPFALTSRMHSDRAQQNCARTGDPDGPVSDRPRKNSVIVPGNEAEIGDGCNAMAQTIGRQRRPPGRKGEIEERLDLPPVILGLYGQGQCQ